LKSGRGRGVPKTGESNLAVQYPLSEFRVFEISPAVIIDFE
jgi:hypothetical protein